jgi:Anti-sigma-28 factor, FlgM
MPIEDHDPHAGSDPAARTENRRSRMSAQELSERIRRGAYEVDPSLVADAMLRRPGVRRLLLGETRSDEVLEAGD